MQFKIIMVPKYNRDTKILLYLNFCINNINYNLYYIYIIYFQTKFKILNKFMKKYYFLII